MQVGEEEDDGVGEGDAARARRRRGRRLGRRPRPPSPAVEPAQAGQPSGPAVRDRRRCPGSRTRRRTAADATAVVPAVGPTTRWRPAPASPSATSRPALAETGPRSDEFFLGAAAAVPVARSTTRVPPPPGTRRADKPQGKESRGARRRRLGIPRRITPRVDRVRLLVAAVPVAAYYVLKWYAYDNWIVTSQGEQIVVKQGQPGGVLWFHPKVVDHTGFTTAQIAPGRHRPPLKAGVQGPRCKSAQAVRDQHHHRHDDHHDHAPRRPRCRAHHDRRHPALGAAIDHDHRARHDDDRPGDDDDGGAMTGSSVPRRRRLPA